MATQLYAVEESRIFAALRDPGRFLRRLGSLWIQPLLATRTGVALFWGLLLGICATRAYIGLSGMRAATPDAFMVLDGAWRMVNGQRPHVDFNSMVGPVAYLPTVIGFQFCHDGAAGFGYGQALVAFVLGAWAWVLSRSLHAVPRFFYSLCLAALAGSPALVGASPFDLSPGMSYNRFTYALLGLVLLECVRGPERREFAGGFSSGAVLGCVTFLKMTGVVIEAVLLVSLLPMRSQTRQRWWGFLCGLVLVTVPLLVYIHFQIGLLWQDLRITAAAKHMVIFDRYDFSSLFMEAAFALLLGVAAAQVLGHEPEAPRLLWAVGVVLLASLGLILGNYQRATLPLVTLMLIVVVDALLRRGAERGRTQQGMIALVESGVLVFVAVIGLSLATSLVAGAALRTFVAPHRPHFHAAALAGFVPVGDSIPYTSWVNEGISLLAEHRQPGEHVMCLDFTNPFTFGLHLPPAAGGTSNLQFHGSFDDQHRLTAERLFGASELVILPIGSPEPNLHENLLRIYGPYLNEHFRLVGESPNWRLYRRQP